ncbi:MAG: hypothetical protein KDB26_07780, partial [Microthrixaceae bacterium]|nr:hypothetical protein [Microthrixaceae bacterium]
KFYDSDIQRLRWILRQQTDHFLPLKVIKKMIDDGLESAPATGAMGTQPMLWAGGEDGTSDTTPTVDISDSRGDTVDATNGTNGTARPTNGSAVAGIRPGAGTADAAGQTASPQESAAAASAEATAAEEKPVRHSATHPSVVAAAMVQSARKASNSASAAVNDPSDGDMAIGTPGSQSGNESGAKPDQSGRSGRTFSSPADIVAALQEDPRPGSARRSSSGSGFDDRLRARAPFEPQDLASSPGDAEFLSAEEVCQHFDIEISLLMELDKFGLISPRRFGGVESYSEADVEVIGVAVRYNSMGIEPRHLRMYKIAAEREAGFIEQLVVPLLKQRNPTARDNAAERSSELAAMGDELRNLILRQHLRNFLGGR